MIEALIEQTLCGNTRTLTASERIKIKILQKAKVTLNLDEGDSVKILKLSRDGEADALLKRIKGNKLPICSIPQGTSHPSWQSYEQVVQSINPASFTNSVTYFTGSLGCCLGTKQIVRHVLVNNKISGLVVCGGADLLIDLTA